MKFEPFIIEKLYKGELVKVQGLGTFRPVEKNTSIHPGDHQFDPPGRSLEFDYNPEEKDNGFAAFIAESKNNSRQDALNALTNRVEEINKELKAGKRVQLPNIGFLHYDFRGQVQLDADQSINYSKEFYGLPGFQGELVTAPTASEKQKEEPKKAAEKPQQKKNKKAEPISPKQRQQEKQKPKQQKNSRKKTTTKAGKKTAAWLIPIALVLVIGATAWYLQDEWKPLFSDSGTTGQQNESQPTDDPEQNLAADTLAEKESTQPSDSVLIDSAEQQHSEQTKQETQQPKQTQSASARQGDYIIIAGCFRSQENANEFVQELNQKGYSASIQGKTPQGLHRVAYGVYSKRRNAINALNKIRNEENSGAWLDRY